MSPSTDLPDIADFLDRLLRRVSREQQPLLLATRERAAAERYRGWADEVAAPDLRSGLLACADREDEIAGRVEALYPDAASITPGFIAKTSDLADSGRSLFAGFALDQQFIQQARGERCGAARWRSFAQDEKSLDARNAFLECALLEEQSAAFLESTANG
jgi:hypothetical protein